LSYQGIGKIYGIKSLVSPSSKMNRKSITFEKNPDEEYTENNVTYNNIENSIYNDEKQNNSHYNEKSRPMLVETNGRDFSSSEINSDSQNNKINTSKSKILEKENPNVSLITNKKAMIVEVDSHIRPQTKAHYKVHDNNLICKPKPYIAINLVNRQKNDEVLVCSICLDAINDLKDNNDNKNTISNCNLTNLLEVTGSIIVLCGHTFHIECCLKLDDDKCPLCRYSISPLAVSTCSLCSCENDLWMCLICGTIGCGELGDSSNHRREHYINTGHIYAKGLAGTHNVTFDFTRNCSLNNVIQFLLTRDFTNCSTTGNDLSDVIKDPKEKVESIMSEYNSIISSQLENQRRYYLDLLKRTEENFILENTKIERDIEKMVRDIKLSEEEFNKINLNKKVAFEELKEKDDELKIVEKDFKDSEEEYQVLAKEKNKLLNMREKFIFEEKNKIAEIESDIHDLESQIKDLNIHMKTLEKVKKDQISGASIEFITKNNKKNSKKK
jgi:hypothetical protein